ncbi:MAG: beta strand repeat-containing protein, partial [Chitinophagaceae bacterium]
MKSKSLLSLLFALSFVFAKSQVAPSFNGGIRQTLSICQNSGINVIDSKMVTTDPDAGQTLTYTIVSAPVNGTVHGFPGLTSTGAGGIISPSGFDYAPANGYNGLDSFTVNVNDGTFSAQTKIVVTVNALPTVNAITGNASACLGGTSQLSNTTPNGVWSSSNVFVADISNTGLVTAQAAGTATISYTVTNGTTGCSNAANLNFSVGGYPVVQPITGTTTVCVGNTTQLNNVTSNGVWSSNNVTRATVSSTGLVTGIGAGAVTITYTVTNAVGCATSVTSNITVNAKPNIGTISATTTTICVGSTTTLTIGTIGGTWSTSNAAVATVTNGGPTSGTVTGAASGTAFILYTITNANGCVAKDSVQITVNNGPTVNAITGPTTMCVGNTIILFNTTNGGTWSATPAFRASITSGGVLTAITNGAIVVTYSVTSGGCTKSVTYNVQASNAPNLGAISGSNQVCVASTTTLTNSTGGGNWSSTNTSIATVTNGGVVTGVAPGIDTIVYIVTNGAGCSDTVGFVISVTSSISVNPIQGGSSVCTGSTLTLTNSTTGGVWASSDNSIAIVIGGVVTPIKAGVVAITYTVGSGACSNAASKNIIINPSPSVGTIDGNTAVCFGSTSQLTNTTPDGVWSSSNTNLGSVSSTGLFTPNFNVGQSVTISYTVTNSFGCTAASTAIVTINTKPTVQQITGTNSTCVGSLTTFTVSTPTGGVWTSFSNNTIAQPVASNPNNSASVIGISPGTDTIYYTVTNGNGCATVVSRLVTISNALVVAPITGSNVVCIGATPNPVFTNTTTGGTWSSSNTAVLNIGATNGQAIGIGVGTATVNYLVDKGGTCVATQTLNVTVANRPAIPTISGANSVCVDASITLTGTPTGGKWALQIVNFSSYLSLDSTTGIATALAQPPGGQVGVNYIVRNAAGCTRTSNNYNITINAGSPIGQIQPNPVTVCVGANTTLTNTTPGGVWEVANTSIATIDSVTGVITGVANGNTLVRYVVTNITGCASVASRTVLVNTTPNPGTLSGQSSVCVGSSTTFIATATNGTWSSSNTSVATVTTAGVVTGRGVGNAVITYTVSAGGIGGCTASTTKSITVNAVPTVSEITSSPFGQNSLCVNATLQLNNATIGGVWSSSNTSRATVSSSGLVTGVSAGAIIITYTVSNGTCSATAFGNGTVYALPVVAAINGSSSVCVGSNITLTNDSTGGVWSSDNTSLATVSSAGVVTGVAAGTVSISYTKTNSNGCTKTVSKSITINSLPSISVITGTTSLCVGATTTLSNATIGGTWSSVNTSVATVNNSGVVSGVGAGIVAIKYIVTNASGCSDSVSTNVTVNALPSIASIAGSSSVCVGSSTTLTNATTSGVWSSSNINLATINNAGLVNGLNVGTTTIKYLVTNASNCTDSVTTILTVNALPNVAAITGNTPVCVGSTRNLANATSGGVWSSNATTIATVNGSGAVLGVSAGTATIKYQVTNSNGCVDSATTTITVNALPVVAALTGTNTVCVNSTTTYASTTPNGVWASSNTNVATVVNGVVTGVAAGSATISYAVTNANGCITTVTRGITVNALPTVNAINGASSVCVNANTTLTSTTVGGVWTSSNTSVASINSNTGLVTAITTGTTTITYTVSNANGCINSVTKSITINPNPIADFNINNDVQCLNTNSFIYANTSITPSGTISNTNWNLGDNTTFTTNTVTHTYTNAATYQVKLLVINTFSCKDSIVRSVVVKPTSTSSTLVSICPSSLPYVWNGNSYTTAGNYTYTTNNIVGCDSVATLLLTIKSNTTSTTNHTACNSYTWNGTTYTTSGVYTYTTINSKGCDSVATLNLTVNYSSTSTTNQT